MNFSSPAEYNQHLIDNLTEITLENYFKRYHDQFYPDQDISFMDYFLEICQKKHEFCVPHTKLFEYGIMSETSDSNDVKRRLNKLNLKNDMHYRLRKVPEPVNQGGYSTKNIYMLKPKAFKKLLMRAGKNSKQTIDVEIYSDYYLLLEDVYVDYTGYERGYNKKVRDMLKQDKSILLEKMNNLLEMNQTQTNLIETQSGMIETQSSQLTEQSSRMDQLLKFAEVRTVE